MWSVRRTGMVVCLVCLLPLWKVWLLVYQWTNVPVYQSAFSGHFLYYRCKKNIGCNWWKWTDKHCLAIRQTYLHVSFNASMHASHWYTQCSALAKAIYLDSVTQNYLELWLSESLKGHMIWQFTSHTCENANMQCITLNQTTLLSCLGLYRDRQWSFSTLYH